MATRTRTVEQSTVQGGDARIEEYLESKGVAWTFRASVPVEEFDVDRSLRNQVRFEAVDEETVEVYAEAMRRGDVFPPNVVYSANKKYVNIDGNHRLMSSVRAKKAVSGVYDVTGADQRAMTVMAFELNTRHGKPTSEAERIQQALYLMELESTIEAAANAVNLPVRVIKKAVQKAATKARFDENGIAPAVTEKLTETIRWRLSQVTTDEGFVAAVNLVAAAKLSTDQVLDLVTRINSIRSSNGQVKMIEDVRADVLGDIQASGGGVLGAKNNGKRVMGPRSRVALSLSSLEALPEDLSALQSVWVGHERDEIVKRAREGAKRLNALARALTA